MYGVVDMVKLYNLDSLKKIEGKIKDWEENCLEKSLNSGFLNRYERKIRL